jgi:hypothetical protein
LARFFARSVDRLITRITSTGKAYKRIGCYDCQPLPAIASRCQPLIAAIPTAHKCQRLQVPAQGQGQGQGQAIRASASASEQAQKKRL